MEYVPYEVKFENDTKTSSAPVVVMSQTLLPTHTNAQRTAFGGQIMAWMDICAGIAAKRHCRSSVVTATMDDLHFRNTATLGDVITVRAKVNRTFHTSMDVGVTVEAENLLTGETVFVCSGYFIFVAVNGEGKAIPVPQLEPKTEEDKRLYHEAEQRKQLRAKTKEMKKIYEKAFSPESTPITYNKNLPFKKPSESAAEVSHLVLVSHANTIGVTFGGQIMSWMEGCATIAAMRHSRRMCITVSVDSLHFLHPIQVGEAVVIKAKVNNTFGTSMEVGVKVSSENLMTGELKHCNSAYFTFLAIEDGKPAPVPQLVPETDEDKKRYHEALTRRELRLQRKVLFEDIEMIKLPSHQKLVKVVKKLIKSAKSSEDWEAMHDNDGIKIWFKDNPVLSISEERMCCMKGELNVDASPQEVLKIVSNLDNRLKWDSLFTKGSVVEQIDMHTRILHMVYQPTQPNSNNSRLDGNKKNTKIDFCILQCRVENVDDSIHYVITEWSTKHADIKPSDDSVRGQVFSPSGFVIMSVPSNGKEDKKTKTRVVYIVRQLGNEALGASSVTQWEAFMDSLVRLRSFLSKE